MPANKKERLVIFGIVLLAVFSVAASLYSLRLEATKGKTSECRSGVYYVPTSGAIVLRRGCK